MCPVFPTPGSAPAGGGPTEVLVVELSVSVIKLIIIITFTLEDVQKKTQNKYALFGCCTAMLKIQPGIA